MRQSSRRHPVEGRLKALKAGHDDDDGSLRAPRRGPLVSHLRHVPLRTMVKLPHLAGFADIILHAGLRPLIGDKLGLREVHAAHR